MIFAMNYTFTGWSPQYIYWHMPLRWFRFYSKMLEEVSERQQAAAKGKKYVPRSEIDPERMEQQNDRIRRARIEMNPDGDEFENSLYSD